MPVICNWRRKGCAAPRRSKATPADLLATIRRMALLQIDSSRCRRAAPYLCSLYAGQYEPRWLEQLLADGEISNIGPTRPALCPRGLLGCCAIDARPRRHGLLVNWLATHQQEIGQLIDRFATWPGAGG